MKTAEAYYRGGKSSNAKNALRLAAVATLNRRTDRRAVLTAIEASDRFNKIKGS